MCFAMAFSVGVPVVVGWEFPSERPGGKRQRMSFSWLTKNAWASRSFLSSSGFRSRVSALGTTRCPPLPLWTSASATLMRKHFSREASTGENIPPRGTGMSALKHPVHPHCRLDYTSQHAPPTHPTMGGGGRKSCQPMALCLGSCGWCVARQLLSMATEVLREA